MTVVVLVVVLLLPLLLLLLLLLRRALLLVQPRGMRGKAPLPMGRVPPRIRARMRLRLRVGDRRGAGMLKPRGGTAGP